MVVEILKLKEIKLLSGEVKTLEELNAIEPKLPKYGKEGDACMDVYPVYYEYDHDRDRHIYHSGLAFAIGKTEDGQPNEMVLRPRSNLTKSEFYMPNSPATLDFGYRGELMLVFKNRTSRELVDNIQLLTEVVGEMLKNLHLPDNLTNNSRIILSNVKQNIKMLQNKITLPPYECNGEDRCCQLIINAAERIEFKEVDKLDTTDRGDKGFGDGTGGAAKN